MTLKLVLLSFCIHVHFSIFPFGSKCIYVIYCTGVKDVMKLEGTGFYPSEKATEDTVQLYRNPKAAKKEHHHHQTEQRSFTHLRERPKSIKNHLLRPRPHPPRRWRPRLRRRRPGPGPRGLPAGGRTPPRPVPCERKTNNYEEMHLCCHSL